MVAAILYLVIGSVIATLTLVIGFLGVGLATYPLWEAVLIYAGIALFVTVLWLPLLLMLLVTQLREALS